MVVSREEDNFILVEVSPGKVTKTTLDLLREEFSVSDVQSDGDQASEFLFSINVVPSDLASDQEIHNFAVALAQIILGKGSFDQVVDQLTNQSATLENFSVQDAETVAAVLRGVEEAALDEARPETFIFAAGDIANPEQPAGNSVAGERRVERFFLSPGLEGFEEKDEKRVASLVRGRSCAMRRRFAPRTVAAG